MSHDDVLLEKIANHYLFYGSFHSDFIMHDIPEIVYTKILLESF